MSNHRNEYYNQYARAISDYEYMSVRLNNLEKLKYEVMLIIAEYKCCKKCKENLANGKVVNRLNAMIKRIDDH